MDPLIPVAAEELQQRLRCVYMYRNIFSVDNKSFAKLPGYKAQPAASQRSWLLAASGYPSVRARDDD